MTRGRTLMAVHAHPDDEALFTGGVLARYAGAGVRTVLVTCTGGELGFGPGGTFPGSPGHVPAEVARLRAGELRASCAALGVEHLELLGYRDSGMAGWPQNTDPGAFWSVPVAEAAARLATVMEAYRPDVLVTYDADGFYGHPDHIQAHRVAVAAADATGIPAKTYYVAMRHATLAHLMEQAASTGTVPPGWVPAAFERGPGGDALIGTAVDCTAVVDAKFRALSAHASQVDNRFFTDMGPERYARIFAVESYVRGRDRTGSPVPEDDLFTGVG